MRLPGRPLLPGERSSNSCRCIRRRGGESSLPGAWGVASDQLLQCSVRPAYTKSVVPRSTPPNPRHKPFDGLIVTRGERGSSDTEARL
jgi:hypothetical protein